MSDYISVHTGAVIDNAVTTVINGRAGIQGIISNGTEIEPNQNNKISINIPDISQSTGDSTTSTMSQNAITNQLREKANSDLLNNYYQKTESYSKTEIDNMIAVIPKFDIKIVLTLPTENISESTIYLVPTQQEEGGSYQEYVYINSRWELIGGQSVDLSDYYTKQVIDNLLNDKLDTGEVVQTTGYNTDKVMSQKAVTDIVNDKFDKSSINNYYNKSETDNLLNDRININKIAQDVNGSNADYVVSQSAIKSALNGKIDKSWIKQETGNDSAWIMSQNAITSALDGKIDKSAIEQGPGQSNLGIMSQKAVTDYLDGNINWGFYQEGEWTPEIGTFLETEDKYFKLRNFTEYEYQEGQYIKIGKLCHVNFAIKVKITNYFEVAEKEYATIMSFPYRTKRSIRKQALAMMDIGSINENNESSWKPDPGVSYEFRGQWADGNNSRGWHAHIEGTDGIFAIKWPQILGRWIYVAGSGTYITE